MSDTWYLVQIKGWSAPWWMSYGNEDYWLNVNGGRTPKAPDDKVFEQVEADYDDLDHKKTGLFVEESVSGWLDRSGRWYPCDYTYHDNYAERILKDTTKRLEAAGWARVRGLDDFHCEIRLSAEQRNWLLHHGHKVEDNE